MPAGRGCIREAARALKWEMLSELWICVPTRWPLSLPMSQGKQGSIPGCDAQSYRAILGRQAGSCPSPASLSSVSRQGGRAPHWTFHLTHNSPPDSQCRIWWCFSSKLYLATRILNLKATPLFLLHTDISGTRWYFSSHYTETFTQC